MNKEKLLDYLIEQGTIDIGCVEQEMQLKDIEAYIKEHHKDKIFRGNDGRWHTNFRDESRKSGRVSIAYTKREKLIKRLYFLYTGEDPDKKDELTLETLLPEFEQYKRASVEEETIQRMHRDWNRVYSKSKLIKIPLTDLKVTDIDEFLSPLTKQMMVKDYNNTAGILKQMLDYAEKKEYITRNLYKYRNVNRKKLRKPKEKDADSQVFYDDEVAEIERLALADFQDAGRKVYRLAPLAVLFAFQTGVRGGELTGLMHEDIKDGKIYINRVVRRENGTITTTKSECSRRGVVLTSRALQIIDMVNSFKKERNIPLAGFLFSEYDRPLSKRTVESYYTKYCDILNTEHKSCHCARKTYATALFEAGVNIKIIMEQMGHEDAKTTYKSYIHDRTQDEQKKNLLENALDYQCNQSVIKISSVS